MMKPDNKHTARRFRAIDTAFRAASAAKEAAYNAAIVCEHDPVLSPLADAAARAARDAESAAAAAYLAADNAQEGPP